MSDLVAVWGIGATVVPVGWIERKEWVETVLDITEPDFVLGSVPDGVGLASNTIPLDEPNSLSGPADSRIILDESPSHVSSIIFTSGSVGEPKGVELTNKAFLSNVLAFLDILEPRPDDRLFFAIPYHFMSAICHFLAMAIHGAELIVTENRPMFADLHKAVCDSEATCFGGAPVQLQWLAECAAQQPLDLRWVMSSGDRLSVDVIRSIRTHLPQTRIFTVYGQTELGGRFCVLPPELVDEHAGSVGWPIGGLTAQVLDDQFQPLPAGEAGDIFANGRSVFSGYLRNPEATAKVLTEYGVRTGDLGFLDEGGRLHITGRSDDAFKCHGEKVSAILIVDALMETAVFSDVAVIGWDHPKFGTVPMVFYVPADGAEFDKARVLEHIRGKLPNSHIPRIFAPVTEIPRRAREKSTGRGSARLLKRLELHGSAMCGRFG